MTRHSTPMLAGTIMVVMGVLFAWHDRGADELHSVLNMPVTLSN